MKLVELQEVLGEQIRLITDESKPIEERTKQVAIATSVSSLAKQIINNADVVLRAEKLIHEGKIKDSTIGTNDKVMSKRFFQKEESQWLKDNICNYKSCKALTIAFNEKFGANRSYTQVYEHINKRLHIRTNYHSNQFGYDKEKEEKYKVGDIVEYGGYQYVKMLPTKGSKGSRTTEPYWMERKKKIWQEHYGELPKGYIVIFLDQDNQNYDITNLYATPRQVSILMTINKWWTNSREHTLTAIKLCELMVELKKQDKKSR